MSEYTELSPFLLKIDVGYFEKVSKVIKGDKMLKLMSTLILNRMGIDYEEALSMSGVKLDEFKELLELPLMQALMKEVGKDAEAKVKEAEAKAKEAEAKFKKEAEAKFKKEAEAKAKEAEAKAKEAEAKFKKEAEAKAKEAEAKVKEAEAKSKEFKIQEIKQSVQDILEIKFGAAGLKLSSKVFDINNLNVLYTLKSMIKISKDINEIEEYIDSIK